MAHQICENDTMFSVVETPWHRLGIILDKPPTTEEAIRAANLSWTVESGSVHLLTGAEIPGWKANVRSDTEEVLGIVGDKYRPIQNVDAFAWFQPWLDAKAVTLETAGSLKNGRIVWVLAKIAGDPMVIVPKANDVVEGYILLSNAHDGTRAAKAGFTGTRVVCANTMAMALNEGSAANKLLSVRHSKNAKDALSAVRDSMDLIQKSFRASEEQFRAMARLQISEKDLRRYVLQVFSPTSVVDEEIVDDDAKKRVLNNVIPLFESGRGNSLPGVAGSMWSGYNAITEYLSHERGHNDDNRLDSLWFGESNRLNFRALKIANEMVRAAA